MIHKKFDTKLNTKKTLYVIINCVYTINISSKISIKHFIYFFVTFNKLK